MSLPPSFTIKDISVARTRKCDDNAKVSVKELLALVADDMERGELKDAKRAIILVIMEPEDGPITTESYRYGMSSPEQIGYLELEKVAVIKRWKGRA